MATLPSTPLFGWSLLSVCVTCLLQAATRRNRGRKDIAIDDYDAEESDELSFRGAPWHCCTFAHCCGLSR